MLMYFEIKLIKNRHNYTHKNKADKIKNNNFLSFM